MIKLTKILLITLFTTSVLAFVFDGEPRIPDKQEWEESQKGPLDDVEIPGTDLTWGDIS